ncbi:MAG: hypothetical protein ACTHOD_17240, partial [Motilibacteraceae bacterium]
MTIERTDRVSRDRLPAAPAAPARRRPVAGERARARRAPAAAAPDPRRTPAPAAAAAPVTSPGRGGVEDRGDVRRRRHLLPRAGRAAAAPTDQVPPREPRSGRLPARVRRVRPFTAVLAALALLAAGA